MSIQGLKNLCEDWLIDIMVYVFGIIASIVFASNLMNQNLSMSYYAVFKPLANKFAWQIIFITVGDVFLFKEPKTALHDQRSCVTLASL